MPLGRRRVVRRRAPDQLPKVRDEMRWVEVAESKFGLRTKCPLDQAFGDRRFPRCAANLGNRWFIRACFDFVRVHGLEPNGRACGWIGAFHFIGECRLLVRIEDSSVVAQARMAAVKDLPACEAITADRDYADNHVWPQDFGHG